MTTIAILISIVIAYAWGHGNGTSRSADEVGAARRRGWEDGYTQGRIHGREDAEARRVMARTLSQRVRETAEWN